MGSFSQGSAWSDPPGRKTAGTLEHWLLAMVVSVGQAEHRPHPHLSWQRLQQMTPLLLVQAQEAVDWVFDPWMLYFGLILIHSLADGIQLSKALQDPKGRAHEIQGALELPQAWKRTSFKLSLKTHLSSLLSLSTAG